MAAPVLLLALAACVGDDPSPPSEASATLGAAGGSVNGPDGVSLSLAPGALATDTTLRIARDSTSSPALTGMTLLSPVYAVTPHGTEFATGALLRLPYDASLIPSGATAVVLRGEPDGSWHVQPLTDAAAGVAAIDVSNLSWYAIGVCTPGDAGTFGFGIGDCPANSQLKLEVLDGNAAAMPVSRDALGRALPFPPDITSATDVTLRVTWSRPAGVDRVDSVMVSGTNIGTVLAQDVNQQIFSHDIVVHLDPASTAGADSANGATQRVRASAIYCWQGFIIGRGPNQSVCWSFDTDVAFKLRSVVTTPSVPVITTQPQPITVLTGQPATFTMAATSTTPMTITWLRSDDGENTWTLLPSTSNTYTLPAAFSSDNGAEFLAHVCSGTGALLRCVDTTAVKLTVSPAIVITTQPQPITVLTGQPASFTMAATSTTPMTITWLRSDDGENTWTLLPSTSDTYTLPAASSGDNGAYFLAHVCTGVGAQKVCVDTTSVQLTVSASSAAPGFTVQPANVSVMAGQTAIIAVNASGTPAPRVRIYRGTAPGGTLAQECAAPGSGNNTPCNYTTPALTLADSGAVFYAVADSTAGSATSSSATVTVSSSQPSTAGACFGDASGWCYLQPAPVADSLAGLVIDAAAAKVYAVGVTNGFTMRSSDRGNSWDVSWDAARYEFRDLAQPSSGVLVAAGGGGLTNQYGILRSTNGGVSWTLVFTDPDGNFPNGVAFADANVGIAVGAKVWRTTDGGATWSAVSVPLATLPAGSGLIRPSYAGNDVFVAVAGAGTFLRSTDRGLTWTRITTAGTDYLTDIAFGGAGFGVATQQTQAGVLQTSDYGATWSLVPVGFYYGGASGAAFADANTVVVMGSFSGVARSTDGGSTWSAPDYTLAAGQQSWRVRFSDASFGLAAGQDGAVARTIDGGVTWTRIAGGRLDDSIQKIVTAPGGAVTLASTLSGPIKRSTDAGLSWSDLTPQALSGLAPVSFGSANVVMGFGLFGTVAISSDAGATWTNVFNDATLNFNGGAMATPTTAIAYGRTSGSNFGTGGFMQRTTDAGATWSTVVLPTAKWLYPSRFLTPSVGLVGGQDGTLLRTTDAGATWTAIDIHPAFGGDTVQSIARLSDTVAVLSTDSEIKRSTDGGLTWTQVYAQGMQEVAFRDASTGIAVGNTIATSSNGGQTWTALDLPVSVLLTAAAWPSATTPVIGGDGGALLRNQRSGALSTGRAKAKAVRGVPTRGPLSAATIAATKRATSAAAGAATRKPASLATKRAGP